MEGPGSSMASNVQKGSSSSVDWLGKEMLELRLGESTDRDDDRTINYIAEHVVGTVPLVLYFKRNVGDWGDCSHQDRCYQGQTLQKQRVKIMQMLDHPNIVALQALFLFNTDKEGGIP
ncbi:Shaggy-related protein kinase delta [Bienertia sinuspersici]